MLKRQAYNKQIVLDIRIPPGLPDCLIIRRILTSAVGKLIHGVSSAARNVFIASERIDLIRRDTLKPRIYASDGNPYVVRRNMHTVLISANS